MGPFVDAFGARMKPLESWAAAQPLRLLLDHLSDAVLLFDRHAVVTFANGAALRLLAFEPGMPLAALRVALGDPAVDWLHRAITASGTGAAPASALPDARLPDGRSARLAWQPLDARHSALRIAVEASARSGPPAAPGAPGPVGVEGDTANELLRVLWSSPYPVTLQSEDFRFVDVNPAYEAFTGYTRSRLVGTDPIELQPEVDRARSRAAREALHHELINGALSPLQDRRLIGADGRERWFRLSRRLLQDGDDRRFILAVLQDSTAEHAARERADRSARELDHWFDLSPVGMVLYDRSGLLVRTNPAFEQLAGALPAMLSEALPGLQELLAWSPQGPAAETGGQPLVREGWLPHADGGLRRLRANVRAYQTPGGQSRYMAVVEDRSLEEERDLAQMQVGALMDTAGVGLATFRESSGWVGPSRRRTSPIDAGVTPLPAPSVALQSITREMVVAESLPNYERLQSALRHAERAEVRYAIAHPELGQRWLLTRVEPATLGSGQRTTSVVTLDVTEQHQTQARTEQLLHELSTILDSTTAGIAYIRGEMLVRCNRRFEAMLRLAGGSAAGERVDALFGRFPQAQRIAADTLQALTEGMIYETEFEVTADATPLQSAQWYALSVRRTGPPGARIEAIAVLSDITRLKSQQLELERLARDHELMFSLSEVGIAYVRNGYIQRANDALSLLTGHPVDQLNQLPLAALFIDSADYERHWAHEELALRAHGRWSGERPLRRSDGRLLWVQVSKRLVVEGDPSGGIIASYVNVDDRHRAEQSVALQAERTRAILDSVLVGIVTVGPGGIEWMNRSARRMFGGDLADFLNLPISTVAPAGDDHPFKQTHYLNELVEGQAETFECRVKARDGREFWVAGNVVATGRETTGRQLTYALLDIERRRQAEARIAEAQASLQRIIEAAPLAITLRDARSLRIIQINEVAAAILGKPPDLLVGQTPEDIYPPEDAALLRRDMRRALASSEVTKREYTRQVNGGTRFWDARYLPLAEPGREPDQLLLVATDVTEQRVAQQAKFDAAIAQREMLVKEVHHRIKNNLQGVAGLLQQIAQRKPEVAQSISEVVTQVQAIAQVYGLQVGMNGPLRLHAVMQAITGSVQRTFGRTITLEVLGTAVEEWSLPEAESIPIALTLNELLTNAVKHSQGGDPVACTLTCAERSVSVAIANTARLAADFDLARYPGGVSGLGLVRALLPRRSAQLSLEQQGDRVVAIVALVPPGVNRLPAA